jgi:uncharacterized membrane protein
MASRLLRRIEFHLRTRLVAGLLAIIPLAVTFIVLRFIFTFLEDLVQPLFKALLGRTIPGLGIASLIVLLYIAGLIATNVIGGRILAVGHRFLERIPVVRTIYTVARQATDAFSGSNARKYSRVVLLDYPRQGIKTLGLVTGTLKDDSGHPLLAVYIPTTPNPTSGYLALVPEEQVTPTDLTVEEAMRVIVSGGILTPKTIPNDAKRKAPPRDS